LIARASRDPSAPRARRLLRACGLLAVCFAALMVFSRLYADGAIIFDNRLLSPLMLAGSVAVAAAIFTRWRGWLPRERAIASLMFVAWAVGSARLASVPVRELNEDGWGFASRDWQSNDLADWLRGDGRGYALFSDNTPATYSLTGRPSRHVPDTIDDSTTAQFGEVLAASRSAIVSFTDAFAPDHPRGEAFANKLGMVEVLRSDEGSVWVRPGGSAQQQDQSGGHPQDHDD